MVHVPDFEYILQDMGTTSDEEIRGTDVLRAILLLLKYVFHEDFWERVQGILELVRELEGSQPGLEVIFVMLKYISDVVGRSRDEDLRQVVRAAFSGKGAEFMQSIAEGRRQ